MSSTSKLKNLKEKKRIFHDKENFFCFKIINSEDPFNNLINFLMISFIIMHNINICKSIPIHRSYY